MRIEQYERFVENCEMFKEMQKSKRGKDIVVRRNSMVEGASTCQVKKVTLRSKSLLHLSQACEYKEAKKKDRYSLPELPERDPNFTLDERVLLWQCSGEPQNKKRCIKSPSLMDLIEEIEEELKSVKSKRRSRSIDSCVT